MAQEQGGACDLDRPSQVPQPELTAVQKASEQLLQKIDIHP